MELTKTELNNIVGGGLSGAVLSSIIKGVSLIFDIGKSFGSALRRLSTKEYCSCKSSS